jgi:hypothetical protein
MHVTAANNTFSSVRSTRHATIYLRCNEKDKTSHSSVRGGATPLRPICRIYGDVRPVTAGAFISFFQRIVSQRELIVWVCPQVG